MHSAFTLGCAERDSPDAKAEIRSDRATWIRVLAAIVLVAGAPRPAIAATISVGAHIPIDANTFAVPIDITAGANVIGWQFDLTYDATDVQVNTTCDPFSGDRYCSFITGPVTEGDFFASGAPFNLLVPGFVDLDPVTFAQTGLLFAVNGRFGGSAPPFPSGNGTLAFVEFTVVGNGTSPINVVNSFSDTVAVPEPMTLVSVLGGLTLPGARQVVRRVRRR